MNSLVINGYYQCNQRRLQELNERIYDRNIPSQTLQSNFDPRPVKTRQVLFPALDCYPHIKNEEPIKIEPTYNQHYQFNPGQSAPYSGYATFVDQENRLKNIYMTNQKWCGQTNFVPSSNSDLYVNRNIAPITNEEQSQINEELGYHSLLFEEPDLGYFNPNPCNLGTELFYNHTRQQILNLPFSPPQQNQQVQSGQQNKPQTGNKQNVYNTNMNV
jgi:hypothetical protein